MDAKKPPTLALGDSNTGFFHASAKARSAKNKLSVLENNRGTPVYEEEEIAEVISSFYTDLFRSSCSDSRQTVLDALEPCITNVQNEELIKIPEAKEIKEATFAINGEKAPGPDGFSASFFQSN